MSSSVCTLFEGNYHYGLATLVNSLHTHGFQGSVYAGYRGPLPHWADKSPENPSLKWSGGKTFQVVKGLNIHFLPIDTEYHLTNYKPNFMLKLWEGPAKGSEAIAYFDPDITIKCKWDFFENWMRYGVALVHEIVANDMPPTHPLRKEWEKVIQKAEKKTTRELYSYFNGGFCGISKNYFEFLYTWDEIFKTGMKHFELSPDQWKHSHDRSYVFYMQDQDALNIAAMCSESPISEMGPEGMDLIHSGWVMSHAVGSPKPWKKKFLLSMLKGVPPSLADKAYWRNVAGPIQCYSPIKVKFKQTTILLAAFFGRFYSKS